MSGGANDARPPSASALAAAALEYPSLDYSSKVHAAPKFSFGARPKTSEQQEDVPGPGSYFETYTDNYSKKPNPPKFSFGSATRAELKKYQGPGPGAYTHRSAFGGGPQLSFTPRREKALYRKVENTPGPGAHNLPNLIGASSPRCTMLPRRSMKSRDEKPGPGNYSVDEGNTLAVKAPPKYGFGSAPQRPRTVDSARAREDSTPGPGAYRHEANPSLKGPKWSMRARTSVLPLAAAQELNSIFD